ncbi:GTP cyclohydrolase I FolE [Rubrobacter marinus]|uniref:GTP cyclohydrolase 1 n=1 Tax=Rubrobacter marinus TaxID=2653852 RepID=A0A6G8PY60_9ACTN|nr:GTP cyclohydrolase I FolE [Rubrobacter marinus]QIN79159.1 GTP cyclohydrolase I FolE [Rubrobacter marinus]
MDEARAARAVREMLAAIGEDPDREGLRETPDRVAEAYAHLFSGLREDPTRHLEGGFDETARDLVLIRDVPLASTCEHHLLPFAGKAHVAYLPNGRVAGFSEIVRVVDGYARRPQLQERLTAQIADALYGSLGSLGSLVVVEATHTCMTARVAETIGSVAVTVAARGVFEDDPARRAEVVALIPRGG